MLDKESVKKILIILLGQFLIFVGIRHFTDPSWFQPIVPKILLFPYFWVYLSGLLEIIIGAGLVFQKTRNKAGKAATLLLIMLYWGNINMWIYGIPIDGKKLTLIEHILRGIAQVAMIAIAMNAGNLKVCGYKKGKEELIK